MLISRNKVSLRGFNPDESKEVEGYNNLREVSIEEEDEVERVWDYGC